MIKVIHRLVAFELSINVEHFYYSPAKMLEKLISGDSVYDVIYPFFIFIKYAGLFPLSITGDRKNGVVRTTILDWFLCINFLIGGFCMLYVNLKYDTAMTRFESPLINSGNNLATFVAIVNLLCTIIMNAKERFNIWDCLRKFHLFDLEVQEFAV